MSPFDGTTYDRPQDCSRLQAQLATVRGLLFRRRGEWITPAQFELESERRERPDGWAALSARVRDLRKAKFGGHDIQARRVPGGNGLWEYRLAPIGPLFETSAMQPPGGRLRRKRKR